MSSCRSCGPPCHNARHAVCTCWCGGLFHGEAGRTAREAFAREYGGDAPPSQPEPGSLFWPRAIQAAREARAKRDIDEYKRRNAIEPPSE
jgi:hypothetical protein